MFNWKPGMVAYRDVTIKKFPTWREYILVLDVRGLDGPRKYDAVELTALFDNGEKLSWICSRQSGQKWQLIYEPETSK